MKKLLLTFLFLNSCASKDITLPMYYKLEKGILIKGPDERKCNDKTLTGMYCVEKKEFTKFVKACLGRGDD